MFDRSKKLPAFFYETPGGNQPVRDWIKKDLSPEDRQIVGTDIQKVEFGWPIGRVIFCVMRGRMVLLNGFTKKTQKAPPREIGLALKRMKELQEE